LQIYSRLDRTSAKGGRVNITHEISALYGPKFTKFWDIEETLVVKTPFPICQ